MSMIELFVGISLVLHVIEFALFWTFLAKK